MAGSADPGVLKECHCNCITLTQSGCNKHPCGYVLLSVCEDEYFLLLVRDLRNQILTKNRASL